MSMVNILNIQNNYKFFYNKNKIIEIYNIGEAHSCAAKFDIKLFEDKKCCFYTENNFRLYNKTFYKPYFIKHGSKKDIEFRKKYNMPIYNFGGTDNLYDIEKYFSYYYKKNNYIFTDKDDIKLIENSKPYLKNLVFCPCDLRDGGICLNSFYFSITNLISIYMNYRILNNGLNDDIKKNKNFLKYNIFNKLNDSSKKSINELIKINYNDFEKKFKQSQILFPFNKNKISTIFNLFNHYLNDINLKKYLKTDDISYLFKYFDKNNKTKFIFDMFNIGTYFYYENELKKDYNKPIIDFINYLLSDNYLNSIVYNNDSNKIIVLGLMYDIIVYMNLNKNFLKYDYHIIYNGYYHTERFNEYQTFLFNYYYKKINSK